MKRFYFNLLGAILLCFSGALNAQSDLVITGIFDGPLSGGLPKGLEIYVANDVADLSVYGIANANNGGPSNGAPLFSFPAEAATAGDFIYLASEEDGFLEYFGFAPSYNAGGAIGVNGDDVVELYQDGAVVDVYGELGVDGSDEPWEYADGWAYRENGTGPNTTFTVSEWTYSGVDANDGQATNETAVNPWPIGTYSTDGGGGGDDPQEVAISEIQETTNPNGASPLVGDVVITNGIVTAVYEDGFWIQDGAGEWSGIFVSQDGPTVAQGDDVTLTGTVQENFDLTSLNAIEDLTVNGSGNALPAPVALSTADAGTEAYESVLISVADAACLNDDLGFGEWLIDDGSGTYRVDDELYNAGPAELAVYNLVGIAHYSFNNFKLLPRDENDVEVISTGNLAVGFETDEVSVGESDGNVTVNVEITNPLDISTSLDVVVVAGGTAEEGVHFNFTDPTTLMFPESSADPLSFSFEVIDDAFANDDRTIVFEIQNAENDAILTVGTLTITIQDDDTEVMITDIEVVSETDADGAIVNGGETYTIAGIVYGPNMRLNGLSFTVKDQTGGIGIFSPVDVDGYEVAEGDSVVITGVASQFNGLAQLDNLESIELISQGNEIDEPVVVTELSEATESELIKIECVTITEPGQWSNSGSGFNVTVTDGTNEFAMRIVNAVDLYGTEPPTFSFDLVGIGGQFDNSSPFLEGYQIFPRSITDLTECINTTPPANDDCADAAGLNDIVGGPIGIGIPSGTYTNVNATTTENDPNPNDTEEGCWFGDPLVQQTVWFSFTGDGGFYFLETLDCGVADYIDDGDTQMAIFTGDCGDLTQIACNEDGPQSTETEYPAGLNLQTEEGVEYLMMIDGYVDSNGQFCVQFTAQEPDAVTDRNAFEFDVYPNPATDRIFVEAPKTVEAAVLVNVLGQQVREFQFTASNRLELDVNGLDTGMYILQLRSGNEVSTTKILVD